MRLRERQKSQERAKLIRESLDREFHKSRIVLMGLKALRWEFLGPLLFWEMERLVGGTSVRSARKYRKRFLQGYRCTRKDVSNERFEGPGICHGS